MLSRVAADSVPGNACRCGHYALGLFDRIFIYTSKRRSIVDESFFVSRRSIQILQFFRRSPFEKVLQDVNMALPGSAIERR